MSAGLVSAAPVLYEDFTTNPATKPGPLLTNATVGAWYNSTAANYNSTDGTFRLVRPGNDGGISSLIYVLDGSSMESGQQYAVNLDFSFANDGASTLLLDLWDVDYGTGDIVARTFKWSGGNDLPDLATTGDATATELVDTATWFGGNAGSVVSTNFVYDGSGDIMLRIMGARSQNQYFRVDVSSVEVIAIPEPATLGMVTAVGGAILFIRRRFMM